ncbi:MAG: hypothetical protein AB7V18_19705 [Pyrinomonadaceae bacterium]
MLKNLSILILLWFGISGMVFSQGLIEEHSPFRNLRSIVSFSQNGEYLFVAVPPLSIDAYIENDKGLRRRAGYSESEIENVWRSKLNRDQIKSEVASREKYPVTGLYQAGKKEPIQRIDDFPQELDKIYVSNNGSFIIGVNIQVLRPSINGNTSDEELRQTDQKAIYAVRFGPNPYVCSKNLSELVKPGDDLMRTSEGFYWAQADFVVDLSSQSVTLEKLDTSKLTIDLTGCTLRADSKEFQDLSDSDQGNSSHSCLAIVLISALMFMIR